MALKPSGVEHPSTRAWDGSDFQNTFETLLLYSPSFDILQNIEYVLVYAMYGNKTYLITMRANYQVWRMSNAVHQDIE